MSIDYRIRLATAADAAAISELVVTVATAQLREEFTDDGWELFLRLISRQTQQGLIADTQFQYLVACDKNAPQKIFGLLSSKHTTHVFHFFILPEYQRQGIGTALWRHYLFHMPPGVGNTITVKSSDFACAFYLQLGFKQKQPRCIENGLAYTLLHYTRDC